MIETLLNVEGMTCGSCVRHVHDALASLGGVDAVSVRQREGQVLVRHARSVEIEVLQHALDDAGYAARPAR